jgi:hypothetical protein
MAERSTAWAGWILFAAVLLGLSGAFNIIQGLAAIFHDEVFVVRENQVLAFDFTAWGVIMLLLGVGMILVALALNAAIGWARIVAIIMVGLHAIAQVGFLSAHPLWSVLVITLDMVVLYALTVRWDEAVAGMDSMPEYAAAPRQEQTPRPAG